ncbi:hypothetical protein CC86DRAFT_39687 [Ophiobolus disseminans]|uniref:Uncharacterized protein n=1 Tax=Ophiobolus disseminans TaxID=1469910 RepID=A0A6A6ZVT9_9PLEO|nr:hypothetical protein CC86DRAFT_39687 [Ophiobolus disseminans]
MPRFLSRIFSDNPFRREQTPPDELHRTRRVLVRTSTNPLAGSSHGLSFFETALQTTANARLRDGASVAGSNTERPILAPSLVDHEASEPVPRVTRTRRRLSKRHRKSA